MSVLEDKKIIIIEDSSFSRAIIYSKLKKIGFSNIAMPETSLEAWDQIIDSHISNEPFDLVITDLNMPDLDGMDLVERIKSDPATVNIKVIVISADADKIIIKAALQTGANSYLTKPIEDFEFRKTVLKFLGVTESDIKNAA